MPAGEPFQGLIKSRSSSPAEVNEHLRLLLDDDYVDGVYIRDHRNVPIKFSISGLTMKGHEFLANARNDTVRRRGTGSGQGEGPVRRMTVLNGLFEQAAKKYSGLD